MWPDELMQGFWTSGRRQVTVWQRYQRLGTLSFIGMVSLVAVSSANKISAVAATLTDWQFEPTNSQLEIIRHQATTPRQFLLVKSPHLVVVPNTQLGRVETQQSNSGLKYQVQVLPSQKGITQIVFERSPEVVSSKPVSLQRVGSVEAGNRWLFRPLIVQMPTPDVLASPDSLPPANLPINQGGVVKVPPVKRPEAILPSTGTPTTPPATVPPPNFPTTQIPTLNVPTLESTSAQTPAPLNTSKPLEGSFRRISPAINPVPVIDFGQPLPKITPAKPMPKLQSFLPRLYLSAAVTT